MDRAAHLLAHTSGLPAYRRLYAGIMVAEERERRPLAGRAEGHDLAVAAVLAVGDEEPLRADALVVHAADHLDAVDQLVHPQVVQVQRWLADEQPDAETGGLLDEVPQGLAAVALRADLVDHVTLEELRPVHREVDHYLAFHRRRRGSEEQDHQGRREVRVHGPHLPVNSCSALRWL